MAKSLLSEDRDDRHLLNNFHYLSERRCLKERLSGHAPLQLRRSVSLEDTSTDTDGSYLQKTKEFANVPSGLMPSYNPQLSSSLNSLCVRLRKHQLLPEYDQNIARSADESDFNWWKTAARLRPIFERIIATEYKQTKGLPPVVPDEEDLPQDFEHCKRRGRRNAVCLGVDRLCYNEQLTLFATIANEVQLEFNLMFSAFKL